MQHDESAFNLCTIRLISWSRQPSGSCIGREGGQLCRGRGGQDVPDLWGNGIVLRRERLISKKKNRVEMIFVEGGRERLVQECLCRVPGGYSRFLWRTFGQVYCIDVVQCPSSEVLFDMVFSGSDKVVGVSVEETGKPS